MKSDLAVETHAICTVLKEIDRKYILYDVFR